MIFKKFTNRGPGDYTKLMNSLRTESNRGSMKCPKYVRQYLLGHIGEDDIALKYAIINMARMRFDEKKPILEDLEVEAKSIMIRLNGKINTSYIKSKATFTFNPYMNKAAAHFIARSNTALYSNEKVNLKFK